MKCNLVYFGQTAVDGLIRENGRDITEYLSDYLDISEDYNTLGSEMSFSLHTTEAPVLPPGGTVCFYVDEKAVLAGRVTGRSIDREYTVHDAGWYLGKSELVFQSDGNKAADIIKQAVNNAGIKCGYIPEFKAQSKITPEATDESSTGGSLVSPDSIPVDDGETKPSWFFKTPSDTVFTDDDLNICISRVWIGTTPADIIEDVLGEVRRITKKKFLYHCRLGEFEITELSDVPIHPTYQMSDNTDPFDITWALSEITGDEEIDSLVNHVMIAGEWDGITYIGGSIQNDESMSRYGKITKVISTSENAKDSEIVSQLREAIKDDKVGKSRNVRLWGSPAVVPGVVLEFNSPGYELTGSYRVKSAKHSYSPAGCIMDLEVEALNSSERSTGTQDKVGIYGFPDKVGISTQTGCENSAENTTSEISTSTGTTQTVVSGKAWDGSIYAQGKNPDTGSRLGRCTVMQWADRIVKYSNMHGVPADMVAAMMIFESNGNPNVGSRTDGADRTTSYGLLQWKPVYYKKYMSPNLPQTASDPDQAIYTACCALRAFFKEETNGVWNTTNWKRALTRYGTGRRGYTSSKPWIERDRFGMIPNYLSCYSTPSQAPSPYAASGKWSGAMYKGGIGSSSASYTATTSTASSQTEVVNCTESESENTNVSTGSTVGVSSDRQALIDKLCAFERSCVGVIQEPPANPVSKYGYGGSGDQWCSWFQSYCFGKTGLYPTFGCRVGEANAWRRWAQSKGVWHWRSSGYIPRKGDIVIWTSGGESAAKRTTGYISGHIGLIVESNGTGQGFKEGQIKVVEGNAASYYTKLRTKLWDGSSGKYVSGFASWYDVK